MLLVFNTHFKKDDVKMRPRYVYRLYFYFFFSFANITLNAHTLLVPLSDPSPSVFAAVTSARHRLAKLQCSFGRNHFQDHFQYLSEGGRIYMAFEP